MQIIKEKLDIDEVIEKRIKNTPRFLNIKSKSNSTIYFSSLICIVKKQ